ncbi:MAG: asparagine synthase B [Chlorobi bacterium]|nr:asparagine synthase B [Chlorobiota bacterium]
MCGILAIQGKSPVPDIRVLTRTMKHRGPDEFDQVTFQDGSVLAHERLSIIDLVTGRQPLRGCRDAWVIHNGEIYNHQVLRQTILKGHTFHSTCDSEVIVHLFEDHGPDFCNLLDGVFAFAVKDGDRFMAARDPIGVKPLYYGFDNEGTIYFASEMKAIHTYCQELRSFPPGFYYTPETGFIQYYKPQWAVPETPVIPFDPAALRYRLIRAVKKRLMSDVPLGVLLSGGLDSSLIASITKRLMAGRKEPLHSFSVGLSPDAPDMKAAREVAQFLGTEHHEVIFTIEEGLAALEQVIWHLETYDVTTIRAATPMYLLSKAIREAGIKVVLSGEGSDEIFGGYLYFHNAPSAAEFRTETIRRVLRLSTADCLRADKSTMAHGIEARVPFLDKRFLDLAMRIDPEEKQPSHRTGKPEKYILRKAFDTPADPWLPDHILWRQKEQFGDGVGYSWIDSIIEYAEKMVNNREISLAALRYSYNTPDTKEALLFRKLFEKQYPSVPAARTVLRWIPKWQDSKDPSGRVADHHEQHVDELESKKKVKAKLAS